MIKNINELNEAIDTVVKSIKDGVTWGYTKFSSFMSWINWMGFNKPAEQQVKTNGEAALGSSLSTLGWLLGLGAAATCIAQSKDAKDTLDATYEKATHFMYNPVGATQTVTKEPTSAPEFQRAQSPKKN